MQEGGDNAPKSDKPQIKPTLFIRERRASLGEGDFLKRKESLELPSMKGDESKQGKGEFQMPRHLEELRFGESKGQAILGERETSGEVVDAENLSGIEEEHITPVETRELSAFKSRVKEGIEEGLKKVNASRYRDMHFSTDPDQVGTSLSFSTFLSKCNVFSRNIKNLLTPQGFNAITVSKDVPDALHLYDIVKEDGMEILVDPTIGQDLDGHNYFFVGTRQELHELVVRNKDKLIIGKKDNKGPEYWFNELWGWSSRPCDRVK